MAELAPRDDVRQDVLFHYASGTLPAGAALAVAGHLAFDAKARAFVADCESLGGTLLEEEKAAPLSQNLLADTLARLDQAEDPAKTPGDPRLPPALRHLVPGRLEDLPWKRRKKGLWDVTLSSVKGDTLRLLKVEGGVKVPRHTHGGMELTLVLEGAYHDGHQRYAKGDLQLADPTLDHQPMAEAGPTCLCLVATSQPVRFTGRLAPVLNSFFRY